MRESGSETCRFLLQEHYWASNICITGSWLEMQNLGLPWWSSGKDSVLPFQWRRLIPGQGTKILHAVQPKKKKKSKIGFLVSFRA